MGRRIGAVELRGPTDDFEKGQWRLGEPSLKIFTQASRRKRAHIYTLAK